MTNVPNGVPDRLITERATAEILGISPDTLRRLNRRGEGPLRRKISPRRVGYKVSEVEAYRDGRLLQLAAEGKPRRRLRRRSRAS
jgi:predicted DNA-binding transcriptional regulator AlpA